MPKAKIGGYHWQQELVSIQNANRSIRQLLRRLMAERPGTQAFNALLTRIALETGTSDDALNELRKISES